MAWYHEYGEATQSAEARRAQEMEIASEKLRDRMLRARPASPSPSPPLALPAHPLVARRSTGSNFPRAGARDPCPRCGVRGDLGCRHRQPDEVTL